MHTKLVVHNAVSRGLSNAGGAHGVIKGISRAFDIAPKRFISNLYQGQGFNKREEQEL